MLWNSWSDYNNNKNVLLNNILITDHLINFPVIFITLDINLKFTYLSFATGIA